MNGCYNDDVMQLGQFRFQLLFCFVQISYARFVHLLLQCFPHQMDSNLVNLETTVEMR